MTKREALFIMGCYVCRTPDTTTFRWNSHDWNMWIMRTGRWTAPTAEQLEVFEYNHGYRYEDI